MIIDSHTHAWATWPYDRRVPDPEHRGSVTQLLYEMDRHKVDKAIVVCAQIDYNPANNAYVAAQIAHFPDRLYMVADVDSMWSDSYHLPGAVGRLETAVNQYPLTGFTHYLKFEDDGRWLYSDEGVAFFAMAARNNLIASLHCHPHQQPAIRRIATQFPHLPFLLHHLGHPKVAEPAGWQEISASAALPNIYLKLSGFYYGSSLPKWDFPYWDVHPMLKKLIASYSPQRLCWGSDYPVVGQFLTYHQSLEVFRTHCDFVDRSDQEWIQGKTLAKLLSSQKQS